jgi:hypothetical protein
MRVGQARAAALVWVAQYGRGNGFRGAYISGSTIGLPDDAELSPYSDLGLSLDLSVVTALSEPPPSRASCATRGSCSR